MHIALIKPYPFPPRRSTTNFLIYYHQNNINGNVMVTVSSFTNHHQERELLKFMIDFDMDGDGSLDIHEFQAAVRAAEKRKSGQVHKDEVDVWSEH
jgi:hypothetical protein